jgi:mRNA-degrading endonuclease RelE of RelBE toxin-antitoxin system
MPYRIEYSPDTEDHLRAFSVRDRRIILDTIDVQLRHQPTVSTKNRKGMRPNPLAPWELRIGKFWVYYDVVEDPKPVVFIRAIGIKERSIVRIGGKVIQL